MHPWGRGHAADRSGSLPVPVRGDWEQRLLQLAAAVSTAVPRTVGFPATVETRERRTAFFKPAARINPRSEQQHTCSKPRKDQSQAREQPENHAATPEGRANPMSPPLQELIPWQCPLRSQAASAHGKGRRKQHPDGLSRPKLFPQPPARRSPTTRHARESSR
jgi:hypothetical protein